MVLQGLVHVAFTGLTSRGYMVEEGRTFYFNIHTGFITFKLLWLFFKILEWVAWGGGRVTVPGDV